MNDKRLLVIEDDEHTADVIQLLTSEFVGCMSTIARTMSDAKLRLIRDKPDVVLLDFWLDNSHTARDVVKFIHENWAERDRPKVIVMSVDRRMMARAAEIGADAFLVKPFEVDELCMLLSNRHC